MWRINDEAEGRIVNATINVLDRVHKQYLTMCQTEVTTKNIEFSFLINRLMVKCPFPAWKKHNKFTIKIQMCS